MIRRWPSDRDERLEAFVECIEQKSHIFGLSDLVFPLFDFQLITEILDELVAHGLLRALDLGPEAQWVRADVELLVANATSKVYRLWNESGELLYIGCTIGYVQGRLRDHARRKAWYGEVARVTVESVDGWRAGREAERRAIESERPRYNVRYNTAALAAVAS